MPDLSIRLDPDLDEELTEQLISIWTDVTNAGGAVGMVPPVDIADTRALADVAFERVRTGSDHLVVAYENERAVGFLFLDRRPGPLFRHWVTIKRLQVHPSLQGKGYGGRILELTHDLARDEMGLEQIHLTVRGGTGTERFYARHGYETAAVIPNVIRLGPGDDREEIYMIKRFS